MKERQCDNDSYFGKDIGIIEYLVWLLTEGMAIDRVYTFITKTRSQIF